MASTTLQEQYTACCNAYADLLIKLLDSSWQDSFWVAGTVGGVLSVAGEYYFDITDVVYAIDNDMTADEVIQWYDYNVNAPQVGLFNVNIKSWHLGAPRASQADIDLLSGLMSEVRESIINYGEDSPNHTNAKKKFDIANERVLNTLHIYRSNI